VDRVVTTAIGLKLQAPNHHFYMSESVGGHSALVTCISMKNICSFLILSQCMCYRKHESVVRDTLPQQCHVRLSNQNSGKILTGSASGKQKCPVIYIFRRWGMVYIKYEHTHNHDRCWYPTYLHAVHTFPLHDL